LHLVSEIRSPMAIADRIVKSSGKRNASEKGGSPATTVFLSRLDLDLKEQEGSFMPLLVPCDTLVGLCLLVSWWRNHFMWNLVSQYEQ